MNASAHESVLDVLMVTDSSPFIRKHQEMLLIQVNFLLVVFIVVLTSSVHFVLSLLNIALFCIYPWLSRIQLLEIHWFWDAGCSWVFPIQASQLFLSCPQHVYRPCRTCLHLSPNSLNPSYGGGWQIRSPPSRYREPRIQTIFQKPVKDCRWVCRSSWSHLVSLQP